VREGIDDLLMAGERGARWGKQNGTLVTWRIWASVALDAIGEHEQGRALAQEAYDLIQGFDAPRPVGMALRALGMIDRDFAKLEESARLLEQADARLELAHTLVETGAALRRGGQRREARAPLARGADLAERCGARALADRAATELRATGARPRRRLLTGVESLTASERRIAQMAVSGMTNRDIAQALFVTVKTVETHLGRLYRKLDIHSRAELAELMSSAD
jgi:DNA-binding CsgD family transcriptional regulator